MPAPSRARTRPGPRTRNALAALGVVASLATAVWLYATRPGSLVALLLSTDMAEVHADFHTFWYSAVALTQGGDLYDTPAKLTNLNPPLLSVLLAPFAAVGPLTGYRIFAVLTLVMVVGAILAAARELRLSRGVRLAVVAAVLVSSPLHGTLLLGQVYGLLLVGLVAGWIAERRGRPVLAHVLYGVTVALKPSLAPLLLPALVLRRWAPLRAGLAAAALATLTGVLVAGTSSGWEWLRIALTEPVPDTADNASLPGLAIRFGLPPMLGTLLGVGVLAATFAVLGRHRGRVDPAGTAPWAVIAAGLLLSPISWHNYLMLLWPGVLVLLALGRRAAAAAVMLAVAAVPVSWSAVWPPDGFAGDLGRSLYCAVLVGYWVVLLRAAVRPEPPVGGQGAADPDAATFQPTSRGAGSRESGDSRP